MQAAISNQTRVLENRMPSHVPSLIRSVAAGMKGGGTISRQALFAGKGDIYHALRACPVPLHRAVGSLAKGIIETDGRPGVSGRGGAAAFGNCIKRGRPLPYGSGQTGAE